MAEWEVSRLRRQEFKALADYILEDVIDISVRQEQEALLEWRHFLNPRNSEDDPLIFVLRDDEQIKGFATALRQDMMIMGKSFRSYYARDFQVRNDAAGRGILLARAIRNIPYPTYGFPNQDALKIWHQVAFKDKFFILFEPRILKYKSSGLLHILTYSIILSLIRGISKKLFVEELSAFPASMDPWIRSTCSFYSITLDRDIRLLNWKFIEKPYNKNRVFILRRTNSIAGYMVLDFYSTTKNTYCSISDILVHPKDRAGFCALLQKGISILESDGLDGIHILGTGFPRLKSILRLCGFDSENEIGPVPWFIIHGKFENVTGNFICNPSNWFMTRDMTI